MADKYSTIQQHQPLRIPAKWGKEERAFIAQLEETFDDLYRRFGRLGIKDLGKALVTEIRDKYGNVNGITITNDGIDIISQSGSNKHISLESGDSQILINPEQIKMNTPGLVKLFGSGQSVIQFMDVTEGVVFRVDTEGVTAQTFKGDLVNAETIEAKSITVDEIICPHGIPNIVISTEQPESGNNTIWLEQTATSDTPVSYSETRDIANAAESSCPQRTRSTFTYSVSLSSPVDLTDATYIVLTGKMNRKGNDYGQNFTVSAKLRFSDGTYKSLGQVGSGRARGNYNLSGTLSIPSTDRIIKTAVGVVFTLSVDDNYGYLASFSNGHLTVSGEHTKQIDSDIVTVHYIP